MTNEELMMSLRHHEFIGPCAIQYRLKCGWTKAKYKLDELITLGYVDEQQETVYRHKNLSYEPLPKKTIYSPYIRIWKEPIEKKYFNKSLNIKDKIHSILGKNQNHKKIAILTGDAKERLILKKCSIARIQKVVIKTPLRLKLQNFRVIIITDKLMEKHFGFWGFNRVRKLNYVSKVYLLCA